MRSKRVTAIMGLCLCSLWINLAAAETAASLPDHPRLLFSDQGIAQLKQRIQRAPWKALWQDFQRRCDRRLGEKIELPPRGGNWWHWYICPEHGARLRMGKQIGPWQWEHRCPVDNAVLKSDPSQPSTDYDGLGIQDVHDGYADGVRDAGILFQVTGDKRYAERARAILLAYAERYLSYPLHTTRGEARIGGGRVGPQTLDESTWLIPVCQGADLIWNTLSEADRKAIAEKLILPAARDVILAHKMGVHNIQCWKNSAVGLAGFLLGDRDLIRAAIDDPASGYRVQMEKGVQADGCWWEGAWGYHFYTVSAVWPLTEAARNCGINLYGEQFKKMFDAPLALAMPNLVLPPWNDSSTVNLLAEAPVYELAYARYKDPAYLAILSKSDRQNERALWFGVEELPKGNPPLFSSRNEAASGYGILVNGKGEDATWLCLKYGPHGGGHGHPDKLNFILYSRGRMVTTDPGTRAYGSPLHGGWDRATIAHNTLVVDERSQQQSQGKCLAFGKAQGIEYVMADAGPIYKGVRFVRTAALVNANLAVFVDQVKSDRAHTLDLACHLPGAWDMLPPGQPWSSPDQPGYKYMKDMTIRDGTDGLLLAVRAGKEGRATLTLASGGQPTHVITGTGIGRSTRDRVPAAIFRRSAQNTAFVWAISLDTTPVKLQTLTAHDSTGKAMGPESAVAVQVAAGKSSVCLLINPDGASLAVALPDKTEWRSSAAFDVR
ncbi:MAG: heparinase II/III family protein [Candidatus Sumerlaeia bacterium]|nr:heparinase II/III family protein [Candidatus Sumerlaeia bacterium]